MRLEFARKATLIVRFVKRAVNVIFHSTFEEAWSLFPWGIDENFVWVLPYFDEQRRERKCHCNLLFVECRERVLTEWEIALCVSEQIELLCKREQREHQREQREPLCKSSNPSSRIFSGSTINSDLGSVHGGSCYGVTVERGYGENSGSDVPVQRGDENEKTRRTRVKVSLIARVHVC